MVVSRLAQRHLKRQRRCLDTGRISTRKQNLVGFLTDYCKIHSTNDKFKLVISVRNPWCKIDRNPTYTSTDFFPGKLKAITDRSEVRFTRPHSQCVMETAHNSEGLFTAEWYNSADMRALCYMLKPGTFTFKKISSSEWQLINIRGNMNIAFDKTGQDGFYYGEHPLQVLLWSNKKMPILISGGRTTSRKAIFNPILKLLTRGPWDYVQKNSLQVGPYSHGMSAIIDTVLVFPESTVIPQNNPSHWTKTRFNECGSFTKRFVFWCTFLTKQ